MLCSWVGNRITLTVCGLQLGTHVWHDWLYINVYLQACSYIPIPFPSTSMLRNRLVCIWRASVYTDHPRRLRLIDICHVTHLYWTASPSMSSGRLTDCITTEHSIFILASDVKCKPSSRQWQLSRFRSFPTTTRLTREWHRHPSLFAVQPFTFLYSWHSSSSSHNPSASLSASIRPQYESISSPRV